MSDLSIGDAGAEDLTEPTDAADSGDLPESDEELDQSGDPYPGSPA
jgi:hypothetical protein